MVSAQSRLTTALRAQDQRRIKHHHPLAVVIAMFSAAIPCSGPVRLMLFRPVFQILRAFCRFLHPPAPIYRDLQVGWGDFTNSECPDSTTRNVPRRPSAPRAAFGHRRNRGGCRARSRNIRPGRSARRAAWCARAASYPAAPRGFRARCGRSCRFRLRGRKADQPVATRHPECQKRSKLSDHGRRATGLDTSSSFPFDVASRQVVDRLLGKGCLMQKVNR
jgi:hypothetical protein